MSVYLSGSQMTVMGISSGKFVVVRPVVTGTSAYNVTSDKRFHVEAGT